jgi:hypothetical protein
VRSYGYKPRRQGLPDRSPADQHAPVREILLVAGITMALSLIATLIATSIAANLRPVVGLRHD